MVQFYPRKADGDPKPRSDLSASTRHSFGPRPDVAHRPSWISGHDRIGRHIPDYDGTCSN